MKKRMAILSILVLSALPWTASAVEPAVTGKRGVTLDVGRADRAVLKELSEQWNVNLIRYHMRSRFLADRKKITDEQAWKEIAASLPEILDNAREFGITVVLCIQGGPPNDLTRKYPTGKERQAAFWDDSTNLDNLVKCWREIAALCKDRPEDIWFDILNEPLDWRDMPGYTRKWPVWAQTIVDNIRQIDTVHPVVIEPGPGGLCWGFKDFPMLNGRPLIYSLHSYQPHAYSHQGVKNLQGTDLAKAYLQIQKTWPGKFSDGEGGYWDQKRLEEELAPVIAFQKKHQVPIYVGEFSVVRWAPNGAGFLKDNIELFEKYGWAWTFHAFRESHLWSLEHPSVFGTHTDQKVEGTTDRAVVVRDYLRRNKVNGGPVAPPVKAAPAQIKADPAETVNVKAEKAILSDHKISQWTGGTDLSQIQVFGPGKGMPAYGALQPGSVVVRSNGRQLEPDKDYVVDYSWGKIAIGPQPSVKAGDPVEVDYTYHLRRVDSLVAENDGTESLIKGKSHLNVPEIPALRPGQRRLSNIFVDYRCADGIGDIFPVKSTAAEAVTATASGKIPRTMEKIRSGQPVKIVCWGDSVTAGGNAAPGNDYPAVFARMIKEKFPSAPVTVKTVAVGGSQSRQWLEPEKYPFNGKTDICRWEKVAAEKPDLITLEFVNDAWMNDAQVRQNYTEIASRAKALGAELILITPHFTMPAMMKIKSLRSRESRPYVLALCEFARVNNIALADASARWEHLADEGIPYVIYLKNSINHPDDNGHRMFAEELIRNFN